jgi:hypothetical protein
LVLAGRNKSWRLAQVLIAAMFGLNLLLFLHFRENLKRGYADFTVFYTAGTILRDGLGHQLYNNKVQYAVQNHFAGHIPLRNSPLPYIHPPFEAAIFLPLSGLPYRQAFAVWDILSVAVLFAVAVLLRRSLGVLRSISSWKFAIAAIAFFPVFACLLEGQDSILQLLLCGFAFKALQRKSDLLAGCWLGLAAFKFQFILPIVLLLVIWKRRSVALGFLAVAILLVLASVGLVGLQNLLQYPAYVLQIVKAPGLGGVPSELLPNLHGLVTGWPLFSSAAGSALVAVISILLFLFAAWKGWPSPPPSPAHPRQLELQFSLAIVVSGLIAWQTNLHDLSLLVLPLVLLADYCWDAKVQARGMGFALLLPVLPLFVSPLWMPLWVVSGKLNLMAIPLLWWTWKISQEFSPEPRMAAWREGSAGPARNPETTK